MRTVVEPRREIPVTMEVDVIVAGAGMSGIAAAVASARNGADTLLVERNGVVGGVATAGLELGWANHYFMLDGEQVAKGIGLELIARLVERGGTSPGWAEHRKITFDPEIYQDVVLDMLEESGVKLLMHTVVSDAIVCDNELQGVVVENKSGRQAILSKVTVDTTGDADVAARAGAPYEDKPQGSSSLLFRMADIDFQKAYEYVKANPKEFVPFESSSVRADVAYFERMWLEHGLFTLEDNHGLAGMRERAIANGDYADEIGICSQLSRMGIDGMGWNGTAVINTGMFRIDHLDQFEITKAEIQGRKAAFYVAEFLRKYFPGFENAFVVSIAQDLGVRMSRRIIGEYVYTVDDAENHVRFDDVIGRTHARHLRYGSTGVDMPYRILVPQKIDNLLVGSGKSVSADSQSIGSPLRDMMGCLTLGEAAGTAAALSARGGVTPRALDVKGLQRMLVKQGVHLGDTERLKELGLL